ncbi:zinc finger protein Xfin-like [Mizuhopecten yessoensis]|nr:zinc finger protein Xfin-like [Mizuhopecten yessoensis]
MATARQREQTSKKASKEKVTKVSPHSLRTRRSSLRIEDEEDANDPSGCMSLDVLAQVASATLQKEPKKKKLRKRSLQTLELLDLDQIQSLSDKALLSFFSEMKSNEITRNFTYTCYLMPKKCQEQFKSFGNETQARMRMRNHLHKHIEKLIEEFNDSNIKGKYVFQAEPIHVRNKRISVLSSKKKPGGKRTKFTALKQRGENSSDTEEAISKGKLSGEQTSFDLECEEMAEFSDDDDDDDDEYDENSVSSPGKKSRFSQKQANFHPSKSPYRHSTRGKSFNKRSVEDVRNSEQDDTERRMEENEQFIIDLLSRTQPHHDHCYTTIFGKKRGIDDIVFHDTSDEDTEEDDIGDHIRAYGKKIIRPEKGVEPILCLGNVSVMDELTGTGTDEASKTIIVCSEEIIDDLLPDDYQGHNGKRPYPPMPKYAIAKRGRVHVPEEYDPISEEEEPLMSNPKRRKKGMVTSHQDREINVEWERKLALKCIRELKLKKKEDRSPLHCRICKDKKFTASATLMYHYRSHAGIKPFVCLICNTTFTRQHSLNYHMLIHNNQSRFTCKDCGRKFRHPSHFKEHLRRHTGETPFVCTDCPQKFKTRNTYKRHLKTRHGKLLTAAGIRILSVEEFAKIRTKPYRRNASEKKSKILCRNLDARVKTEPVEADVSKGKVVVKSESVEHQSPDSADNDEEEEEEEEEEETDSEEGQVDHEENSSHEPEPYFVPISIVVNT